MYLCRYVINAMGGKITVTSQVDKGTVFHIELPVKGKTSDTEEFGTIPNEMTTVLPLQTIDSPTPRSSRGSRK